MKVLHVQNITGIAGSEMYLLNALPALKKQGIEVHFLCLHPSKNKTGFFEFKAKLEAEGIPCYSIGFKSFPFVFTMRKLHQLLGGGDFDLVHSHLIHADYILSYYKRFFNSKLELVSTKHGYQEWYNNKYGFDPEFKKNNLYLRVAKFAEKQMNASIAISKGLFKLYTGLQICKEEKLRHIPYGFDFESIEKEDSNFRKSKQQLVLVGRLTAFKGHRYAIEAMDLLREKLPELKLLFIGTGDEESNLKAQVKKLKLEAEVLFMGWSKEARSYMKNSDLVLVPSISEGFGVVVLEAFSVAKPIVAFDVPSLNEHIRDGQNGRIIPAYDVSAFAAAIESLIIKPEESKLLGKEGERLLQDKYSLGRMTKQTLEFYDSLHSS